MSVFVPLTPEQQDAEHAEMKSAIDEFKLVLEKHPDAVAALNEIIPKGSDK